MGERGMTRLRGKLAEIAAPAGSGWSWRGAVFALGATAAATLAMLPFRDALGVLNALLIFLLLCFVIALVASSGPAALAALFSFLSLDFFFIPPYGEFSVAQEDHLLALVVYLGIAIVTGHLVARARMRTEMAERERQRAALLAESDELKSVLLAAVSHDLRTPLAVIKTSVTSLLDDSVTWGADERSDFLRAIDEETDHLTRLVQGLLDLSRIEGGALRPNKEWSEAAEVIEDVAARQRTRAEASGHRLAVCVEPDLPIVAFDYVEIAQALTNLVDNALKHTPPGTTVTITARRAAGAIEVAVADTGPGIPARELARVFEKFHRLDASRPGSGIGLAIAKGFVEANGGAIWAESRPGEGAAFRFTLPAPEKDEPCAANGFW